MTRHVVNVKRNWHLYIVEQYVFSSQFLLTISVDSRQRVAQCDTLHKKGVCFWHAGTSLCYLLNVQIENVREILQPIFLRLVACVRACQTECPQRRFTCSDWTARLVPTAVFFFLSIKDSKCLFCFGMQNLCYRIFCLYVCCFIKTEKTSFILPCRFEFVTSNECNTSAGFRDPVAIDRMCANNAEIRQKESTEPKQDFLTDDKMHHFRHKKNETRNRNEAQRKTVQDTKQANFVRMNSQKNYIKWLPTSLGSHYIPLHWPNCQEIEPCTCWPCLVLPVAPSDLRFRSNWPWACRNTWHSILLMPLRGMHRAIPISCSLVPGEKMGVECLAVHLFCFWQHFFQQIGSILGRARPSRDGLIESCTCRRCALPPPRLFWADPPSVMWWYHVTAGGARPLRWRVVLVLLFLFCFILFFGREDENRSATLMWLPCGYGTLLYRIMAR